MYRRLLLGQEGMLAIKGGLVLQKDDMAADLQQTLKVSIGDIRAVKAFFENGEQKITHEVQATEEAARAALQRADADYRRGRKLAEIAWDRAMAEVATTKQEAELALAAEKADREVMEARSIDVAAKRSTMVSAQRQAGLKNLAEAVEQRQGQWKEDATEEGISLLDALQGGLDVAGLTPGLGILPDAANTVISVFRGRWFDAGANALAMIPILGQGTKGAQLAYKGGKLARAADKLEDAASLGRVAPKVTNPKLNNLVDNLYKGAKGPNPIGTGSTADAVRNELITGLPTCGRFHSQKAQETINGLTNWLRKNPNASHHDRLVAQSLLDDLKAALGGN